jgi:predicted nuclease of predicted toxin-antitoxin system
MRLYLDDDSVHANLVRLLRKAGHALVLPADFGSAGSHDAIHFKLAIREQQAILTANRKDFPYLHELILQAQGHHFGVLLLRKDNDPKRDLRPAGIVQAIANLLAANIPIENELHVLNHWR